MDDEVMVGIPVSPAAAEALRDSGRARAVGLMISSMVKHSKDADDLLWTMIAQLKADVHAAGLTDEMIDEELAAYNAERRS